jgi:hypothetical protein
MPMKGRRMPPAPLLKRRAFFVDERALREARRAFGAASDAEAIRMSVERIAEMEKFWRFMRDTRKAVPPGSFEEP